MQGAHVGKKKLHHEGEHCNVQAAVPVKQPQLCLGVVVKARRRRRRGGPRRGTPRGAALLRTHVLQERRLRLEVGATMRVDRAALHRGQGAVHVAGVADSPLARRRRRHVVGGGDDGGQEVGLVLDGVALGLMQRALLDKVGDGELKARHGARRQQELRAARRLHLVLHDGRRRR